MAYCGPRRQRGLPGVSTEPLDLHATDLGASRVASPRHSEEGAHFFFAQAARAKGGIGLCRQSYGLERFMFHDQADAAAGSMSLGDDPTIRHALQ